jgi:hypothetical protein
MLLSAYNGRKITASLGNVTVRGEKRRKGQGGSALPNSLNMYSITENIYYSQLSSVAILLQPEPNCCTSYSTRKGLCSLSLLSSCGLSLPRTCLVLMVSEARSYYVGFVVDVVALGQISLRVLQFPFRYHHSAVAIHTHISSVGMNSGRSSET